MGRATSLIVLLLITSSLCLKSQDTRDFSVTDVNGESHSLYEDYLDQNKVVVIFILHSLCPSCNAIAADFQSLYSDWGSGNYGVQFMGLSNKTFDTDSKIQQFNAKYRVKLPMISAEGGSIQVIQDLVQPGFSIPPLFLVIKPDRSLIYDIGGDTNESTLAAIDNILVETGVIKPFVIQGSILAGEIPVQSVMIEASGGVDSLSNAGLSFTDELGIYEYSFSKRPDSDEVAFVPSKNHDFDNGLSTLDIVIILRHLLRTKLFDEPEDHFRADINRSGSITVSDVVDLRKILIQIDTAFENNTSWRFFPTDYQFLNPEDPLQEEVPEWITIADIEDRFFAPDFNGIKVGDLNNSANPQLLDSRIRDNNSIDLIYHASTENGVSRYDFYTDDIDEILGLQMGFDYDQSILSNPQILDGQLNFHNQSQGAFNNDNQGHLFMSFSDVVGLKIDPARPLFSIVFNSNEKVISDLGLANDILKAEIYDLSENTYDLKLVRSQEEFAILYPNPVDQHISIAFRSPYRGQIDVITPSGQLILSTPVNNEVNYQISLDHLNPGMYILRCHSSLNITEHFKIVKL